jgi:hypothetical protein
LRSPGTDSSLFVLKEFQRISLSPFRRGHDGRGERLA